MAGKDKGRRGKDERAKKTKEFKPSPIAVPSVEIGRLEGLIDLLVWKGLITDEELITTSEPYYGIMNGLLDLLEVKGVIHKWELDIAMKCYQDFILAVGPNPTVPPQVLFNQRRQYLSELLEIEKKVREGANG